MLQGSPAGHRDQGRMEEWTDGNPMAFKGKCKGLHLGNNNHSQEHRLRMTGYGAALLNQPWRILRIKTATWAALRKHSWDTGRNCAHIVSIPPRSLCIPQTGKTQINCNDAADGPQGSRELENLPREDRRKKLGLLTPEKGFQKDLIASANIIKKMELGSLDRLVVAR
ncbi:hypothetical protein WISP_116323 [Willisornis vidua]|uniref:Uncharacterized protein n=1 Tax=Willisornis vidua TaxID=1566151 RepID=A0ABQ9CWX7_9PASS|nr:hypothetical protein WISP_116323 [Willisornis vidua]